MKKIISLSLATIMFFLITVVCMLNVSAANNFAGGDGTKENPYRISSALQLDAMRNDLTANYILINDIDLSLYESWEPIGNGSDYSNYFTGTLNGCGHKITGMKINANISTSEALANRYYLGLFGYVQDGTISNLQLEGNISLNIDTNTEIRVYVGMLAGYDVSYSESVIENCRTTGQVTSLISSQTYAAYCYTGGMVGYISALYGGNNKLINCSTTGDISSSSTGYSAYDYVGGITGYIQPDNQSSVLLNTCYSTGNITSTASALANSGVSSKNYYAYSTAGGLVGTDMYKNTSTLNSYAKGNVISTATNTSVSYHSVSNAGGLFGTNFGEIKNCYALGNVFSYSTMKNSRGYSNAGGLVGNNTGTIDSCLAAGNVELSSNGIFSLSCGGGMVGDNSGTIINSCSVGDVSALTEESTCKTGGFVGTNMGTIECCYAQGDIQSTATSSSSYYSPYVYSGGFVGTSSASDITNCYSMGNVRSVSVDCSETGSGKAYAYVGGFVGSVVENFNKDNNIANCYTLSSISSEVQSKNGTVSDNVGGFTGANPDTIENCYFNTETSEYADEYGIGLTTSDMKYLSSYSGFDFENVWKINPTTNDGYPYLKIIPATFLAADFVVVDNTNNKVSYVFNIISNEKVTGVFVVALYDESDCMVGLEMVNITTNDKYVEGNDLMYSGVPYKYKAFLWGNFNNLEPFCKSVQGFVE